MVRSAGLTAGTFSLAFAGLLALSALGAVNFADSTSRLWLTGVGLVQGLTAAWFAFAFCRALRSGAGLLKFLGYLSVGLGLISEVGYLIQDLGSHSMPSAVTAFFALKNLVWGMFLGALSIRISGAMAIFGAIAALSVVALAANLFGVFLQSDLLSGGALRYTTLVSFSLTGAFLIMLALQVKR